MQLARSRSISVDVPAQLHELLAHLRQAQSTIVVCVAALRRQNCEIDEDVAAVLQHAVANALHEQIEKTEALLPLVAAPADE